MRYTEEHVRLALEILSREKGIDRSGSPKSEHPKEVAEAAYRFGMYQLKLAGYALFLKICGLLHDSVEDGYATLEELEEKFGRDVRDVVDTVSRREGERYQVDYIEGRVGYGSVAARILKITDLKINIKRLEQLPPDDPFRTIEKRWTRALKYLEEHE